MICEAQQQRDKTVWKKVSKVFSHVDRTQVQMTASLVWLIETSQIKFMMKARCLFIGFRKRLKSAFANESLEKFKKTKTLERTGRNQGGVRSTVRIPAAAKSAQ